MKTHLFFILNTLEYNPNAIVGLISPTVPINGSIPQVLNNIRLYKLNYDFVNYGLNFLPNPALKRIIEENNMPLICYTVTSKEQEQIAIANNANFIWSAINKDDYMAPKTR
jgi:hypothetical protein